MDNRFAVQVKRGILMEIFIGKVWLNEDFSDACRDYTEVYNPSDDNDRLDYRLAEYIGKTVKITIEEVPSQTPR